MTYWEWSKIGKQLKNENRLDIVIMDLSEASDTLNHKVFFSKITLPNNTNALEQIRLLVTGKV